MLLILAGVTISLVLGENGIFGTAQMAKEKSEIAEEKEKIQLAITVAKVKGLGELIKSNLIEEFNKTFGEGNYTLTDNGEGLYTIIINGGKSYSFDEQGTLTENDDIVKPTVMITKVSKKSDGTEILPGDNETETLEVLVEFEVTIVEGEIISINPDGSYETTGENPKKNITIDYEIKGEIKTSTVTVSIADYFLLNHSEVEAEVVNKSQTPYKNKANIVEVRKGYKEGEYIPIPKGFKYVKGDEIGGAVITDTQAVNEEKSRPAEHSDTGAGNEFVWVPVKNAYLDLHSNGKWIEIVNDNSKTNAQKDETIRELVQAEIEAGKYPMAIKIDSENYIGVLYDFSDYNTTTKETTKTPSSNWTPISNDRYKEPDIVSYYDNNDTYLTIINTILGLNEGEAYTSSNGKFLAKMKKDYNDIVKKVEEYGGFYIGRYEMSEENEKIVMKYGKTSITNASVINSSNTNKLMWYGLYAKAQLYENLNANIKSNMPYGCQYDQMMIWMSNNGINVTSCAGPTNYDVTGKCTEINFSTIAGTNARDRLCNIYDLFGNYYEITSETYAIYYRGSRRRF